MTAILIISAFFLAFASFSIVRTKRAKSQDQPAEGLPPIRPSSLFGADGSLAPAPTETELELQAEREHERLAEGLLARARTGDRTALDEAHASRDKSLYAKVLDALVSEAAGSASSEEALARLVSDISASDDLRGTRALAEAVRAVWRNSPGKSQTATLLRAAALADDAGLFEETVEEIFRAWQTGRLPSMTERELRALAESEYWLLGSEARRSGAGFMLKERLAAWRRRLPEDVGMENPQP